MDRDGTFAKKKKKKKKKKSTTKKSQLFFFFFFFFSSGKTLQLLFERAAQPSRVFVGLVDQRAEDDVQCVEEFCRIASDLCAKYRSHIRVTVVRAADSKGPVFARAKQRAMQGDELFCMQIDAHSQFVLRWDDELIAEWLKVRNEYAVLSTYVHHIDRLPINHLHDDVPYICKTKWGEGHMIRNEQASSCVRLTRPKLSFSWGAGLSFSKCHATRRVPYDPNLPQIFDGEEFSIAMRLFTNGYDVYTPGRNLVFHDYSPVPRHWSAEGASIAAQYAEKQKSWLRLRTLFKMPEASGEDLGEYGLGTCRSYESFVEFSGVDPRIGKASLGDQCGNSIRVPWNGDCWPPETLPPIPTEAGTRPAQPVKGLAANEFIVQTKNERHGDDDDDDEIELDDDEEIAAAADDERAAKRRASNAKKLRQRLKVLNYLLLGALATVSLLLWCWTSSPGNRRRTKDEMLSV
jgi:hypothetical protein